MATSYVLQTAFSSTSSCATSAKQPYSADAVGLNLCYPTGKKSSVIYGKVLSSSPANVNFTSTLYSNSATCTGASVVTSYVQSKSCQPNANGFFGEKLQTNTAVSIATSNGFSIASLSIPYLM